MRRALICGATGRRAAWVTNGPARTTPSERLRSSGHAWTARATPDQQPDVLVQGSGPPRISMARISRGQRQALQPLPLVQDRDESIDQRDLRVLDPSACLGRFEPGDAVDLRVRFAPTGTRRPLELERLRHHVLGPKIAFDGPGVHDLSTLLHDRPELMPRAGGWRQTGLLPEFTSGGLDQRLVGIGLTLWDRPMAGITAGEDRAARVGEQDLETIGSATEEQDPGTDTHRAIVEPRGYSRPMSDDRGEAARVAIGAACVMFDDHGRVLLVRHTYGRHNWELPGGGSVPGEAPDATARRELLEETGLESAIDRLCGVYFEFDGEGGSMLHFVFRCRWDPGQSPNATSPEVSAVGYWPIDDLPTPISDFTERRIGDAWADSPAVVLTIGERYWRT